MVIYWLLFSPDKVKEIMFYILLKKVEKNQALNRCFVRLKTRNGRKFLILRNLSRFDNCEYFFLLYIGSLWSTLMQSSSINFSYLIVLYSSRLHISQNKQLWLNEFTHLSSLLWLSAVCTHYYIECMNISLLYAS